MSTDINIEIESSYLNKMLNNVVLCFLDEYETINCYLTADTV